MIIDAHSHIGKDYYFKESNLKEYDEFCQNNNIDIGFLMPMPWPVYNENEKQICSLIWEHENYHAITYYKITKIGDEIKKERIISNPYKNVNYYYYDLINKSQTNTKIKFIPLIHGVLDDPYYLDNLICTMKPVAVKFHGFASGFYKDDVHYNVIDVLKKHDIPIIFHTSVYNYDDGYGASTKIWRNKCSPKEWLEFLIKYDLKGVLNHGACLDEDVIKIVNKNDNIMIGIGPDLDISLDPYKVSKDKSTFLKIGYLPLLKKLSNPEKLVFDLDYNWNLDANGNQDYNSISRIMGTWSYIDSEKILYDNARQFYKLS